MNGMKEASTVQFSLHKWLLFPCRPTYSIAALQCEGLHRFCPRTFAASSRHMPHCRHTEGPHPLPLLKPLLLPSVAKGPLPRRFFPPYPLGQVQPTLQIHITVLLGPRRNRGLPWDGLRGPGRGWGQGAELRLAHTAYGAQCLRLGAEQQKSG